MTVAGASTTIGTAVFVWGRLKCRPANDVTRLAQDPAEVAGGAVAEAAAAFRWSEPECAPTPHNAQRRRLEMTHVVCEPCVDCKYTDCVVVCPVECFYEGEKILYIHPDECIDCEACVPECPVEAIFHEDNVPDEWKDFIQKNAEMCSECEVITEKKEPLADS